MKPHGAFTITAHTLADARSQAHAIVTAFLDGAPATVEITECEPYLTDVSVTKRQSVVGYWACRIEWSAQ